MSWLYSIIFTGLIFAANNDSTLQTHNASFTETRTHQSKIDDESERFEQTYPFTANGRVIVSNVNGSIVVEAWDRNEIKLEAVKTADTKEALADVEIKVDARQDYFSVEADYGSWKRNSGGVWNTKNRKLEVQFRLSVPRTAMLNSVETVNGSITVSNFVNLTKVSAVNGDVIATNLRGAADLETVNGDVVADFDRLESGTKISLGTVNGRASLKIPSDANVTIKAESLNGEITNDFGLPVKKGKYVGRDMYGRVGTGDVQVKLESVNGPLSVNRKNDGKSTNPVTDLLPQKGKADDDDWDGGRGAVSVPDTDRLNRDIARSVRDSQREARASSAAAQKDLSKAQKEYEKIGPEITKAVNNMTAVLDSEEFKEKIKEAANFDFKNLNDAMWRTGMPSMSQKSNTFAVKGSPKIEIDAKGCAVKVRGWDNPEVKYVVTELSNQRGTQPVSITQNQTDSSISLKVVTNAKAPRSESFFVDPKSVRVEVFVPRKSNLKITTDGEIRMDGVSGEIELIGGGESINVRDGNGRLTVVNTDGVVRVVGFNGELDAKTNDGEVYLEGEFSRISGSASDGSFILNVPPTLNADIMANLEEIIVNDLPAPKAISAGNWRIGNGGSKYDFKFVDGCLTLKNSKTISSN